MVKELVTNANKIQAREPQFYCAEWLPIPKNTLTMISAPGGTGKSFLSIQLAIRIIAENPEHKVLLWLSEDPLFHTKDRIDKIFERIMPHLLDKKEEILDQIDIIGSDNQTIYFNQLNKEQLKKLGDEFVTNYNVVVIDPLIAFFSGEENSNSEARAFMNILNRMAQERLLSIVLIHHHNKGENGGRTRGASAFIDAVRLLYTLNTIKDKENKEIHPTKRLIKIEKDNWGVRQLLDTSEFEREILPYKVKEVNIGEEDEKSNNEEVDEKKDKTLDFDKDKIYKEEELF